MRRFLEFVLILCIGPMVVLGGQFGLQGHAEYYRWQERFDGTTVVEENGLLTGVSAEYTHAASNRVGVAVLGDFFGGQTAYDGGIQSPGGDLIPAESDVAYVGLRLEGRLLRTFAAGAWRLTPEAGLGLRAWNRDFEALASDEVEDAAYQEYWLTTHGFLGLGVRRPVAARSDVHGRVRLKLPIRTWERIDLSNTGGPDDVLLHPQENLGGLVELGGTIRGVEVEAFVEWIKFDRSDLDEDYGVFFQPDSEALLAGLRVGTRI